MSTSYEHKTRMLAAQMGVTYEDARGFLAGVAHWMNKGIPFELAVQMHMKAMRQVCNEMVAGA